MEGIETSTSGCETNALPLSYRSGGVITGVDKQLFGEDNLIERLNMWKRYRVPKGSRFCINKRKDFLKARKLNESLSFETVNLVHLGSDLMNHFG